MKPTVQPRRAPPFAASDRRGMTMIEVMVAVVIMTVSVYLFSSTITATIAHSDVKRERALAVEAAMNLIEEMRSEPVEELFSLYNALTADDPGGAGTAPGVNFAVKGLSAQDGDTDGFVGEVVMPVRGKSVLREDLNMTQLGLPRDLNGDLIIDSEDHAENYIILPITIRIEWRGRGGDRSFEMSTMFANLEKLEG